jgi:hypothetical protein
MAGDKVQYYNTTTTTTTTTNNNNNNNNNNNKAEKILKYRDLITEIQRMWSIKTKVIPVITGATGTTSKLLRKYLSNVTRKHEVKELQNTAILGTAHTLRKVLVLKYKRFGITCSMNC